MSFIRQPSIGHYEDLVANRDFVLATCPSSHRRRILGLAPRYRPVKTHEITVDLRTGERQVVTGPIAAPRVFQPIEPPTPKPSPAPVAVRPTLRSMLSPIVDAVAKAFGVTPYQLHSAGRARPYCRARFACYLLASERQGFSLNQIGKHIGRDHTSVLHGIRRARDLYDHDADWRAKLDAVVAALDGGAT